MKLKLLWLQIGTSPQGIECYQLEAHSKFCFLPLQLTETRNLCETSKSNYLLLRKYFFYPSFLKQNLFFFHESILQPITTHIITHLLSKRILKLPCNYPCPTFLPQCVTKESKKANLVYLNCFPWQCSPCIQEETTYYKKVCIQSYKVIQKC